jgi:hypothetical protein
MIFWPVRKVRISSHTGCGAQYGLDFDRDRFLCSRSGLRAVMNDEFRVREAGKKLKDKANDLTHKQKL